MTDENKNTKAEDRLVTFIDGEFTSSIQQEGSYEADNNNLFNRYNCDPYGDEEDGMSSLVSSDVADLVDSDLSAMARVFLGNAQPVEFLPVNGSEDAIAEAQDINAFVLYTLQTTKNAYKTHIDWLKEMLLQKSGWVEYGIRETEKPTTRRFEGLSEIDIANLQIQLEKQPKIKKVVIKREVEETENGVVSDSFDITATVIEKVQEYFVENVPWEDMRISSGIQTKDDANVFGKVFRKRRGDLVAEGMDVSDVRKLPLFGRSNNDNAKSDRFADQGGEELEASIEWQNELVEGQDSYVLFDMDGDGILERRHVVKFANTIIENEPFNHIPYAGTSAIQMPHNIMGKSRGELALSQQRLNTALTRNMSDNISDVNMGRYIINDSKVNMDDVHNVRTRGSIRTKDMNAIIPEPVIYNGDKTLQVIQYMDSKHAQSTGQMQANQALTSDQLNEETATRFEGVKDASLAKIELVARNFAEIAYKDLWEGIAWLARHFQNSETEAYLFGREMKFKPSSWRFEQRIIAKVGTGAGDDEKTIQTLSSVLATQNNEIASGSGLADAQKKYNVYRELIRAAGLHGVENFYNDPSKPDQLLMAENEQLKGAVEQMQLQAEQNDIAGAAKEIEQMKAQAQLLIAQSKKEDASTKARQDMQQFLLNLRENSEQFDQETILKLTEMELKYGQDVPGAAV